MSRGYGTVQRAILAAAEQGAVLPVLYIASVLGYDVTKLSVRQSFSRAARSLHEEGAVLGWYYDYTLPADPVTGTERRRTLFCVAKPDIDVESINWGATELFCMRLCEPESAARIERVIDNPPPSRDELLEKADGAGIPREITERELAKYGY